MKALTATQIAEDAIGLFIEYRDVHGRDETGARAAAVNEVAEAEQARVDLGEATLTEHEALVALNRLRSNVIATQSASWSNLAYPLVAILNAAGFDLIEDVSVEQQAEHLATYGGAGGYPGHVVDRVGPDALSAARNIDRERRERKAQMEGGRS